MKNSVIICKMTDVFAVSAITELYWTSPVALFQARSL